MLLVGAGRATDLAFSSGDVVTTKRREAPW
jgi:hypothetical protein